MRRNKVFSIRELERQNPAGFESIGEGIGTNSTGFSVFDSLPHSPSISSSDFRGYHQTCMNTRARISKALRKVFDLL
jgi:hypothetical protein